MILKVLKNAKQTVIKLELENDLDSDLELKWELDGQIKYRTSIRKGQSFVTNSFLNQKWLLNTINSDELNKCFLMKETLGQEFIVKASELTSNCLQDDEIDIVVSSSFVQPQENVVDAAVLQKNTKLLEIENDMSFDLELKWNSNDTHLFMRKLKQGDKIEILTYMNQEWQLFNMQNRNLFNICFYTNKDLFVKESSSLSIKTSLIKPEKCKISQTPVNIITNGNMCLEL